MNTFKIGIAKSNITDTTTPNLLFQGFADPRQVSAGVLHEIFSRAFVIQEDKKNGKKVAIVIAEIWSCTKTIKEAVLKKLKHQLKSDEFTMENVHIAGTHTHSAPGGYTGYALFTPRNEIKLTTINIIVDGIVKSILSANKKLKIGKIYVNKGHVANCGKQRSPKAYLNNPQNELKKYSSDTDQEMLLLKFVHLKGKKEVPIGLLNWYAIHPNDLGQFNMKISGDNKGLASMMFEKYAAKSFNSKSFIAAFANSNCGDVSGNVGKDIRNGKDDIKNLKLHAKLQFDEAKRLFNAPSSAIQGDIKCWYKVIDMSKIHIKNTHRKTWPYALGLSFAAGSDEDGIPVIKFPITNKITRVKDVKEGLRLPDIKGTKYELSLIGKSLILSPFLSTLLPIFIPPKERKGHGVKPILLTGREREWLVPSRLPVQVFKLGDIALLSIPGELTTMAGRRIRKQVSLTLADQQVRELALGTYANDYSQYITTKEEYDIQAYEGASTPFGPHTLEAYIQQFCDVTLPEDQYIDCSVRHNKRAKFFIEYKDEKGKTIKLNTKRLVESFRFSIPHFAKEAKIRAQWKSEPRRYKPSSKRSKSGKATLKLTRWSHLTLTGSATAQAVIFKGRSIKYTGEIENKKIQCTNESLEHIFIRCHYTSADGKKLKKVSDRDVEHYFEFTVPWDATDIELQVEFGPRINRKRQFKSNVLKMNLGSHQIIKTKFLNRTLRYSGIASDW